MTFYVNLGISSNEIAGAVAAAAICDLHTNNFSFSGFPSVYVEDLHDDAFVVHLRHGWSNQHTVSFSIKKEQGVAAAKNFQRNKLDPHDELVPIVQSAIWKLEGLFKRTK